MARQAPRVGAAADIRRTARSVSAAPSVTRSALAARGLRVERLGQVGALAAARRSKRAPGRGRRGRRAAAELPHRVVDDLGGHDEPAISVDGSFFSNFSSVASTTLARRGRRCAGACASAGELAQRSSSEVQVDAVGLEVGLLCLDHGTVRVAQDREESSSLSGSSTTVTGRRPTNSDSNRRRSGPRRPRGAGTTTAARRPARSRRSGSDLRARQPALDDLVQAGERALRMKRMLRVLTSSSRACRWLPVWSASICETMSWATRSSTSVSSIGLKQRALHAGCARRRACAEAADAILSISSM